MLPPSIFKKTFNLHIYFDNTRLLFSFPHTKKRKKTKQNKNKEGTKAIDEIFFFFFLCVFDCPLDESAEVGLTSH